MWRVVPLTFAVLGWAWWEMSGGADFQPGENGVTLLASAQPALPEEESTLHVARAETTALPLDTVSAAPAQTVPEPEDQGFSRARGWASLTGDAPQPAEPSARVVVEAVSIDYRSVAGNRVNLRSGPGTSFAVVAQLVRGEEVEVLSDPGSGWVKLRTLDGNDTGWMAGNFLVAGR